MRAVTLLPARPGQSASEALAAAGHPHPRPCGGHGRCGNCALWLRGALAPMGPREAALLRLRERDLPPAEGYTLRLACLCGLLGPAECLLPEADGAPATSAIAVRALPDYDGPAPGSLGAAIDIGATTVTLELFRFPDAAPLACVHEMNRQSAYGADVLNRISSVGALGLAPLCDCLRGQLAGMLAAALEKAGASASGLSNLTRAVVTGNTTMLHFFAGLDPTGMGAAPFTPLSLFGEALPPELLAGLPAGAELYLPPSVSAFIGADITCGALATGICDAENALLCDVGTNGEMMLHIKAARDAEHSVPCRLLCCSVAAGPAFEGAEISMGMPALPGAIDRVWAEGGQLRWHAIGEGDAKGVCGTGLISALRAFLERGAIDESGYIEEPALLIGGSGVSVTQQDIRKLQLVKAAVAAGIETLLHESGLAPGELRELWLGGGFGSCLRPEDAAAIGMIPLEAVPAAQPAGNIALRGAEMLLFSRELRVEALRVAQTAKEIYLATHPVFQEMFVEKMGF